MKPPPYVETPAEINGIRVRPAVADFYGCLHGSYPRHASLDHIVRYLWGYFDPPDTHLKEIMVYACHARKPLRGTGWKIENIYGEGYRLTYVVSGGIYKK